MQRRRDQRFARAGGRVEDHIALLNQLQHGIFLCGIKREPPTFDVIEKAARQRVVRTLFASGNEAREREHGLRHPRISTTTERGPSSYSSSGKVGALACSTMSFGAASAVSMMRFHEPSVPS